MNKEEKKILKEMINKNNTIDNTNNIREKKISKILRKEIAFLKYIKRQNTNKIKIENETKNACPTLFNDYKDIYTRLIENNLNYNILYNFLDELEKIENNKLDQHEASYNVGKLLKKIYIDSEIDTTSSKKNISPKKISYSEYKNI
tara:strand:- start:29788 stop:30225 length:438 start_codon:yes stop_codon:yes gene_type:complete